jgi:hypothetical protein
MNCDKCIPKFEKHSYLVNRCISPNNFPIYYIIIWLEVITSGIIAYAMGLTFFERLDNDLVFFTLYIMSIVTHVGIFGKRLIIHT